MLQEGLQASRADPVEPEYTVGGMHNMGRPLHHRRPAHGSAHCAATSPALHSQSLLVSASFVAKHLMLIEELSNTNKVLLILASRDFQLTSELG